MGRRALGSFTLKIAGTKPLMESGGPGVGNRKWGPNESSSGKTEVRVPKGCVGL